MAFSRLGDNLLPTRIRYNGKILRLGYGGPDGFQYLSLHKKKTFMPASEYLKEIRSPKFSDLKTLNYHRLRLEKSYNDMKGENTFISPDTERVYKENMDFLNDKISKIEKDSHL